MKIAYKAPASVIAEVFSRVGLSQCHCEPHEVRRGNLPRSFKRTVEGLNFAALPQNKRTAIAVLTRRLPRLFALLKASQ